MNTYPTFVSIVAFSLGCIDVVRGAAHTILASHAAVDVAGLDLSGPTGRDQLVLMTAFGAANFLRAAALIYLSIKDRFGALVFMAIVPVAYLIAGVGLRLNAADLIGQGVSPGRTMMAVYISVCIVTVIAAVGVRRHQTRYAVPL